MDKAFWHKKWELGELGFHQAKGNPLLKQTFDQLQLPSGARVFLPLCGKTGDIHWLLACGCQVVGCELSEQAVQALFQELGMTAAVTEHGRLKRYRAPMIELWVGDIFDLTREHIGVVDATYDRAALVALPDSVRPDYARQLTQLTKGSPQLLICFEYDQAEMKGPPFSVIEPEIRQLYESSYQVGMIIREPMPDGFNGRFTVNEVVWLLSPVES